MNQRAEKGAWDESLHEAIVGEYGTQHETWALEQMKRVMDRLNQARKPRPALVAELLGLKHVNAFTLPGRYLYVSRRLQERTSDAELAFVLAHEAAHHDLQHFHELEDQLGRVPKLAPVTVVKALAQRLGARVHNAEREAAADVYALQLVLKAGYAGEDALKAFDLLKAELLDHGRLDAVFGPEDGDEIGATDEVERLFWNATAWVSKRLRSHPGVLERQAALREVLARHP